MILFGFLDVEVFLISLGVGILLCYLFTATARVVYKTPNQYNLEDTVYSDTVGTCYKYDTQEVLCPPEGASRPVSKPILVT